MKIAAIDVFCGIGGLSYGFKREGVDVVAGLDLDASCQYAFEENVGGEFLAKDVSQVRAKDLSRLFAKAKADFRVLIGCAPCAPFSFYTGRYRKERGSKHDPRWRLLREFSRLVRELEPDVVSMENVPRLAGHSVFVEFIHDLEDAGYSVSYDKLRAEHFGVPQKRTRLVLLASRHGQIAMPRPTHTKRPLTVRDAIGQLPAIRAGEPNLADRLHVTRGLSPLNARRLRSTKEGGSWRDWDKSLRLRCHNKKSGKSFRSVYGRMKWDEPSPVITTQCLGIGNGRFGHPEQNRAISIREAAMLQTFPRRFRFIETDRKLSGLKLARQIGNAVPVKLGSAIARAIKRHLANVSAAA